MLYVALVVLAVALGYSLYLDRYKLKTFLGGSSAFSKLADAEGKVIALKAATKVKQEEAKAAHAALDEVHKLLG